MAIVVDTSVLIDHLRGDTQARSVLSEAAESGERLLASVLTKVEVLAGMRLSEEPATRALFEAFEWVSVDDELAEQAGTLANRWVRSHPGVDPVDYVVAATAERAGAQLWTRNVRHFPMFPGLKPPY